jgi:hypothetical protein
MHGRGQHPPAVGGNLRREPGPDRLQRGRHKHVADGEGARHAVHDVDCELPTPVSVTIDDVVPDDG